MNIGLCVIFGAGWVYFEIKEGKSRGEEKESFRPGGLKLEKTQVIPLSECNAFSIQRDIELV